MNILSYQDVEIMKKILKTTAIVALDWILKRIDEALFFNAKHEI
jgi:hypothetical protein